LPNEDDGVQLSLSTFITDSISDYLLNDKRFNRQNWTPWQVHHAVAAYISVANANSSADDEQMQNTRPATPDNNEHGGGTDALLTESNQVMPHSSIQPNAGHTRNNTTSAAIAPTQSPGTI